MHKLRSDGSSGELFSSKDLHSKDVHNESFSFEKAARTFNTGVLSTLGQIAHQPENSDPTQALYTLMEKPAFKALVQAARALSEAQDIPLKEASEQIVTTFRQVDEIWTQFIINEGLSRLRSKP